MQSRVIHHAKARFHFLLVLLIAFPMAFWPLVVLGQGSDVSLAYLLVIDHSASMNEEISPNKTRWQEMKETVIDFLEHQIPIKSRLWVAIFDSRASDIKNPEWPLNTEEDRRNAIERINKWPAPRGRTAYYDTLALAFEQAMVWHRENPGMYITIMAYTDGIFERAGDPTYKDPKEEHSNIKNRLELYKRYPEIKIKDEHLRIYETLGTIDKGGPYKPPFYVQVLVSPKNKTLENAIDQPAQSIDLEFSHEPPDHQHLKDVIGGNPVKFTITSEQNPELQIEVVDPQYCLSERPISVPIRINNPDALHEDKKYYATLNVEYPTHDRIVWVPNPSESITLLFPERDKVPLLNVVPRDQSVYPTHKKIDFSVTTDDDADVTWDFGDDQSSAGRRTTHTYNQEGVYKVEVKASAIRRTADNRSITMRSDPHRFTIRIIDIDISIDRDSINKTMVVGHEYKITSTGKGPIDQFKWMVDGLPVEGRLLSKNKSGITYSFEKIGEHRISVQGIATMASVHSRAIVTVGPRPEINITQPPDNSSYTCGQEIDFSANVNGPVKGIEWDISVRQQDNELNSIYTYTTDLISGQREASWAYPGFPETAAQIWAQMTATAILEEGLDDISPPSSSIQLIIERLPRSISIDIPDSTQRLVQGDEVEFTAIVKGEGIMGVKWTATDSSTQQPIGDSDPKLIIDEQSTWTWTCPYSSDPREVVIKAEMVLEGDSQVNADHSSKVYIFEPVELKIEVTGKKPFYVYEEIPFQLTSLEPFKNVMWDFGDGNVDLKNNSPNPTHAYSRGGDFTVKATLHYGSGVKRIAKTTIPVRVKLPVVAIPLVDYGPRLLPGIPVNREIALKDNSEGSIAERRWFVDGEPIPKEKGSVIIKKPGEHRFLLEVKSPPDKYGKDHTDKKEIELMFVQIHWWLISLLLLGWLAGIFLFCRLFLKNHARAWRVHYSLYIDRLYKPPYKNVKEYWSRWKKLAEIPITDMFPTKPTCQGSKDEIIIRMLGRKDGKWDGNLAYSADGGGDVTWSEVKRDHNSKTYVLVDSREPMECKRRLFFRLFMPSSTPVFDYILLILLFAISTAALGILMDLFCIVNGTN